MKTQERTICTLGEVTLTTWANDPTGRPVFLLKDGDEVVQVLRANTPADNSMVLRRARGRFRCGAAGIRALSYIRLVGRWVELNDDVEDWEHEREMTTRIEAIPGSKGWRPGGSPDTCSIELCDERIAALSRARRYVGWALTRAGEQGPWT